MKIGIIGFGQLAQSMVKGLLSIEENIAEDIIISDIDRGVREMAFEEFGIEAKDSNKDLVHESDLVVLSVKPNIYDQILDEISDLLSGKLLISFLAGTGMDKLEARLDNSTKIIRVMPSIAMEVCESLTAIYANENVSEEDLKQVKEIFQVLGEAVLTDEEDLERISVISGSGLGYAAKIISAMAGASRSIGYDGDCEKAVIQVFSGAIKLLESSGISADQMVHAVATEGGTTIEGIRHMESKDLENILSDSMNASYQKVKDMKK